MSQVYAIGSLNLDYVYKVPHFLRPGETLEAAHRAVHWGGKGLNQTVAMLRSGLSVRHCGAVGADGTPLSDFLAAEGSDVSHLRVDERSATGHTFIQVTPDGENAILYYPGTNHAVTEDLVRDFLATAREGDFLVLQNEVNGTERLIDEGKRRGLRVVFNPSPFSPELCATRGATSVLYSRSFLTGIIYTLFLSQPACWFACCRWRCLLRLCLLPRCYGRLLYNYLWLSITVLQFAYLGILFADIILFPVLNVCHVPYIHYAVSVQ